MIVLKYFSDNNKRTFYGLAFLQLIIFVAIMALSNIKYEVSDDYIMEMVVSGAYTGKPDPHYMFSNVILGEILAKLYTYCGWISWYFWGQMLLCFGSYLAITYLVVNISKPSMAAVLIMSFTAFTAKDLYILPQFTKTAIAASMSGLLLLIWGIFAKRGKKVCCYGFMLAFLGALVRTQAFYIAVALAGIVVIYESFCVLYSKDWNLKEIVIKAWIPGAILLASVYVAGEIDTYSYYQDSSYRYYKDFSRVRAYTVDYGYVPYDDCRIEFEKIGISQNDYDMIMGWDFADPVVFNLENMNLVLDILQKHRQEKPISVIEIMRAIRHRQLYYPIVWYCVILGVICIWNDWRKGWAPIAAMIMCLTFLAYFYVLGRWVYRVEFCFFYCAGSLLLYLIRDNGRKMRFKYTICILLILVSATQLPDYGMDGAWKELDSDEYRSLIDGIFYYSGSYDAQKYSTVIMPGDIRKNFLQELADNPDTLYVLDFDTAIQTLYYDFNIFQSSRDCFPKNAVFFAGVTIYHPSVTEYLNSLGYNNLMDALLQEKVYFVSNRSYELVDNFYQEHYPDIIIMDSYKEIDGYQIWKYTRVGSQE